MTASAADVVDPGDPAVGPAAGALSSSAPAARQPAPPITASFARLGPDRGGGAPAAPIARFPRSQVMLSGTARGRGSGGQRRFSPRTRISLTRIAGASSTSAAIRRRCGRASANVSERPRADRVSAEAQRDLELFPLARLEDLAEEIEGRCEVIDFVMLDFDGAPEQVRKQVTPRSPRLEIPPAISLRPEELAAGTAEQRVGDALPRAIDGFCAFNLCRRQPHKDEVVAQGTMARRWWRGAPYGSRWSGIRSISR